MNSVPRCFLLMVMLWPAAVARADITSTSYLALVAQDRQIDVQWSLALRDLEDAVGLDSNGDGEITWGELRAASDRITAYAHPRLRFTSAGIECPAGEAQLLVDRLGGTPYAVLRYTARCPTAITNLDVVYAALFEIDRRHRGLASVTLNGTRHAAVFSPGQPSAHFAATGSALSVMRQFFAAGMAHLAEGADHLLFIAMLLAPSVLRPDPSSGSLSRLADAVRTLTAFTLAHGLTLTLAVLRLAEVPPTLVEPAIALTILLTAADNVYPILSWPRERIAFVFGLIHGLSVASSLGALDLAPGLRALALLSFNMGLEVTQVLIAVALAPIGFCLRATRPASYRVLPIVSGAALIIAMLWLSDRLQSSAQSAVLRYQARLLTDHSPISPATVHGTPEG